MLETQETHSMFRYPGFFATVALFVTTILGQAPSHPVTTPLRQGGPQLQADYDKLPLSFEANQGQADPQVRFTSRGGGYTLFLTDSAAVLTLSNEKVATHAPEPVAAVSAEKTVPPAATDVVRMELAGANPALRATGDSPLSGKANYFIGNDPAKWHTDVPTYAKVKYAEVYPGVDLVYYGNQRQLEYDFVVAPSADPKAIRLHFAGAQKLCLTPEGNLSVIASHGTIAFHRPVAYQMVDGKRVAVNGQFTLSAENIVGFHLGAYDPKFVVVIDPVLTYSSYLGGSGSDVGTGIAVDASGDIYVTGYATSTNFPTTSSSYQTVNKEASGNSIAFVTKMDPTESTLLYSTYLGGTGGERAWGIALDSSGEAFVTGYTFSSNFPVTTGAFQTTNKLASQKLSNGFVSKLSATGASLLYSTYIGGTGGNGQGDFPFSIAVDTGGSAYIAGGTYSGDFPVTQGAYQMTNKAKAAGGSTAFLAKLNPTGAALSYSTYIGGSGNSKVSDATYGNGDWIFSITLDSAGYAYIAGTTASLDFPVTSGAFQQINNSIHNSGYGTTTQGGFSGFITKLNQNGSSLVYSTYLGGSCGPYNSSTKQSYCDSMNGIAVDTSGNAYVTGDSGSPDFPTTPGAFQTTNREVGYGFTCTMTELNAAGSALVYSTYFGGSGASYMGTVGDEPRAVVIDSSDNAFITGITYSAGASYGFPTTTGAYQTQNPLARAGASIAFMTEFNSAGALAYSTLLGGGGDEGKGIALGSNGTIYVTGKTPSGAFPVTSGAYQTKNNGSINVFVSQLSLPAFAATPMFSPAAGTFASTQTVTIADSTSGATIYFTTNGTVPTTSSAVYTSPFTVSSTTTVEAVAVATGYTASPVATATYTIPPNFTLAVSSSTLTVNPSSTGTETVTITSQAGFNAAVTLSCSGLPTGVTCSFSPASVTPANGGSATSQLTITVPSTYTLQRLPDLPWKAPSGIALASLVVLCFGGRKHSARLARLMLLLFVASAAVALGGCSKGTSSSSSSSSGKQATIATVTIAGTSGSLTSSTNLTLTVP